MVYRKGEIDEEPSTAAGRLATYGVGLVAMGVLWKGVARALVGAEVGAGYLEFLQG